MTWRQPTQWSFTLLASAIIAMVGLDDCLASAPEGPVGHTEQVFDAVFSPDGRRVVTASGDRTAIIWDAATGRPLHVLKGHKQQLAVAAFSPDGTRIATGAAEGRALVWDAATGRQLRDLTLPNPASCQVDALAFSPDGKMLVFGGYGAPASLWNVASGERIRTLSESRKGAAAETPKVVSVAFSADGKRVLAASSRETTVWDIGAAGKARPLWSSVPAGMAAFSPDAKRVVVAVADDANDKAVVLDATTGKRLTTVTIPGKEIWFVEVSPDGRLLATASLDGPPVVWDASTGKELRALEGHAQAVHTATFSPDGTRIVTASNDGTAIIWDVSTGTKRASLRGHRNWVTRARFSPDGKRIVTASADATAAIWDAATGQRIHVLGEPRSGE